MDLPAAPRLLAAETFLSTLDRPEQDSAIFARLNAHLSGGTGDALPGEPELAALRDAWKAASHWCALSAPEQRRVNVVLTEAGLPPLEMTS